MTDQPQTVNMITCYLCKKPSSQHIQVCWLPLSESREDRCHSCWRRVPASTGKYHQFIPLLLWRGINHISTAEVVKSTSFCLLHWCARTPSVQPDAQPVSPPQTDQHCVSAWLQMDAEAIWMLAGLVDFRQCVILLFKNTFTNGSYLCFYTAFVRHSV